MDDRLCYLHVVRGLHRIVAGIWEAAAQQQVFWETQLETASLLMAELSFGQKQEQGQHQLPSRILHKVMVNGKTIVGD